MLMQNFEVCAYLFHNIHFQLHFLKTLYDLIIFFECQK